MTKKVLVLKGDSHKAVGAMFEGRGYDVLGHTESPSQADLVVFTGGSDVSPYIYGEEPDGAVGCDPIRDEFEKSVYEACVAFSVPVVGICRGGQLLNVLNGGNMLQDLGTTISGDVITYGTDQETRIMRVDHHQGIMAAEGVQPDLWLLGHDSRPDYAVFYLETKSLCFQPHPEWGHKGTEDYFFELLHKHIFAEKEDA